MLLYTNLLGNKTRVLYSKIQDLYAHVILYEYMLIYLTIINTFQIVTNKA